MTQRDKLVIGLIINGDEILSGKREDRHFLKAKEKVAQQKPDPKELERVRAAFKTLNALLK
jgi:hypothetical protein